MTILNTPTIQVKQRETRAECPKCYDGRIVIIVAGQSIKAACSNEGRCDYEEVLW